jgi:hypothetical protein
VTVALVAIAAGIIVGLVMLFASPASASTLHRVQTAVGVIAQPAGQRVGPHEQKLPGESRERAPGYDHSASGSGVGAETAVPQVEVSASSYPESAAHIEDAQAAGQPSELTIDRAGAAARRAQSIRGVPSMPGLDRDEYPPAMFQEGGTGSSVRGIDPSDNRGAGASIGNQCRQYPDGTVVCISVGP